MDDACQSPWLLLNIREESDLFEAEELLPVKFIQFRIDICAKSANDSSKKGFRIYI